jgi:hypothetical protein
LGIIERREGEEGGVETIHSTLSNVSRQSLTVSRSAPQKDLLSFSSTTPVDVEQVQVSSYLIARHCR